MNGNEKEIFWLHGEIKTPPFSSEARIEAGYLLRLLQKGQKLAMPQSRSMPNIGRSCHELRVNDKGKTWRIIYHLETDAVVILEVFQKTTTQTPKRVIETCKLRLNQYLNQ